MVLYDYRTKVLTNNTMNTFLGSRITQYLSGVHPYRHTIFLTRHGESEYNVQKKIGGDSPLSQLGAEYARRLAEFAEYVTCRDAKEFCIVTLKPEDAPQLRDHLADGVPGHFRLKTRWAKSWEKGFDLKAGMRLVRIQRGYGTDFGHPPATVADLMKAVGRGTTTLVFADGELDKARPARLWTSSLRRTIQTASHIKHPTLQLGDKRVWLQMAHRQYRD